jgi:hypothetical protein
MIASIKPVFGALRLLGKRAAALRLFGLTLWTNAGVETLNKFSDQAKTTSHRAEVLTVEVEHHLEQIVADGRITGGEVGELRCMLKQLKRIEDAAHDIGEAVKL